MDRASMHALAVLAEGGEVVSIQIIDIHESEV